MVGAAEARLEAGRAPSACDIDGLRMVSMCDLNSEDSRTLKARREPPSMPLSPMLSLLRSELGTPPAFSEREVPVLSESETESETTAVWSVWEAGSERGGKVLWSLDGTGMDPIIGACGQSLPPKAGLTSVPPCHDLGDLSPTPVADPFFGEMAIGALAPVIIWLSMASRTTTGP